MSGLGLPETSLPSLLRLSERTSYPSPNHIKILNTSPSDPRALTPALAWPSLGLFFGLEKWPSNHNMHIQCRERGCTTRAQNLMIPNPENDDIDVFHQILISPSEKPPHPNPFHGLGLSVLPLAGKCWHSRLSVGPCLELAELGPSPGPRL